MLLPILTLAPSAVRTASGTGDALDLLALAKWQTLQGSPQLLAQSDVTAASGTNPSLTVTVEDSIDGVNWNTVGTFTAQTAVNRAVIAIGLRGDAYPAGFRWPVNASRVRARWVVSGTNPSFTFSIKVNLV